MKMEAKRKLVSALVTFLVFLCLASDNLELGIPGNSDQIVDREGCTFSKPTPHSPPEGAFHLNPRTPTFRSLRFE